MQLPDVNILVYAYREETLGHQEFRNWLEDLINSDAAYGMSDLVLRGFLRIVTHPAVFDPPSDINDALTFVSDVRSQPNCVAIVPGQRHWEIFTNLCKSSRTRGNLVPDAYLAALAIEHGCEWISMDGSYGRFRDLRWRRPFQ